MDARSRAQCCDRRGMMSRGTPRTNVARELDLFSHSRVLFLRRYTICAYGNEGARDVRE